MTDETRPGPGGDEAGPRKDGGLPVSPARRTRIVLRLRRPARRHPPDRQGPAERGRAEQQVSLGTLADIAGVTRRTIQMYLEGMSATMEVAMRLEEFLNESLVMPVDPFALLADPAAREERLPQIEGFEREMFERLERLGYRVLRTVRSPFDALSKHDETTFLTGVGEADRALERKAEGVSNLSRVVEKDSGMFVERARVRMSIRGGPVIAREGRRRAKDRDDVEEMISERKG